jgi:hypothetical protein
MVLLVLQIGVALTRFACSDGRIEDERLIENQNK